MISIPICFMVRTRRARQVDLPTLHALPSGRCLGGGARLASQLQVGHRRAPRRLGNSGKLLGDVKTVRKTIGKWRFLWENHRKTIGKWMYPLVNALVNVYITNWKDPPFYSWVNPLCLWSFSIAMLNYQRVPGLGWTSTIKDFAVKPWATNLGQFQPLPGQAIHVWNDDSLFQHGY